MSEQFKAAPITEGEADRMNASYAQAQTAVEAGNFQGAESSATDHLLDAQRLQGSIEKGREGISTEQIAEVEKSAGQKVVAMTIPEGHPAHSEMFDTMKSTATEMGHRQSAENFTNAADEAQANGVSSGVVAANRGAAFRAAEGANHEQATRSSQAA